MFRHKDPRSAGFLKHIPTSSGAYDDHTEASPKEIFNAHGISNEIALQLYAIYYPDFIMYNYSIDDFLE